MSADIELRHLRYFLAVAEELHFGRAAQRLHMAQPPLSQQIQRLEEMLGYALFVRTSREVRLTAAGKEFQERARHTLRKIESDVAATQRIGRGEVGSLTVGFIGSGMLTPLPQLLGEYRRKYPEVNLQLREDYTARLTQALLDGVIDVAILRDADTVEGLRVEPLMEEPFIVVLPVGHRLAAQSSIAAKSLRHEPFVLFARAHGTNAWKKTVAACEAEGFVPNVVQEGPQWLTIVRLVGAGLGVTIAPACAQKLSDTETVYRKLRSAPFPTSIELAYRVTETRPLVKQFCEMARTFFRGKEAAKMQRTRH